VRPRPAWSFPHQLPGIMTWLRLTEIAHKISVRGLASLVNSGFSSAIFNRPVMSLIVIPSLPRTKLVVQWILYI
jgi:hypothetical protein